MTHAPPTSIDELEARLSEPDEGVIEALAEVDGDVVIAGVGGKMGPSLARMVRRALDEAGRQTHVYGVSRFRNSDLAAELESSGIRPIRADLLDPKAVQHLPDAGLVISMVGFKFGTSTAAPTTWATNVLLPALLCQRYPQTPIAAFSSGNIYGMVPVDCGGSTVEDVVRPVGEYAHTVLGRERMYEFFGQKYQTPSVLLRLNYAVEMRYGVLVDIAKKVRAGETIDVTMGFVNVIWQGDANRMALRAVPFAHPGSPKFNVAGAEILSVREVAARFAELWDRDVHFRGTEAPDAFLNDATASYPLLGRPQVPAETLIEWIADWMDRGLPQWDLPTHFENRGGAF